MRVFILCCLLSACGAGVQKSIAPAQVDLANSLAAQNLEQGQCGLFLWSRVAGRPLQFFQNATTGAVKLGFLTSDTPPQRIGQSRQIVEGFFAKQSFTLDGFAIEIDLRPAEGRNLVSGITIPKGQISVSAPSGAQTHIAVAGLFGCRT